MTHVGFYGDDFTGSVDALLQYRRAGLDGVLLTGPDHVPDGAELADRAVVGIAGISRSLPADDLATEVAPALVRLRDLGPRVVHYKACSTADSSPEIGSLGRVLELARQLFPPTPVPMILAQPDFGRYTVFGQHFASDGERVHRLDRHPIMARHPVTPIAEAELVRLIGRQTWLSIGSVPWTEYADPDRLATLINSGPAAAVICDALTDDHLELVARAALTDPTRPRFMIGSGGLSLGVGRALRQAQGSEDGAAQGSGSRGLSLSKPNPVSPAPDRTLALSGSASRRTRAQIRVAVESGWQELDLFQDGVSERAVALHRSGVPVVVHTLSRDRVEPSDRVTDRLAEVAHACLGAVPETRLLGCGGDTSGSLLRRIGVRELIIEAEPWGNLAFCRASLGSGSFEVILKGGQMGTADVFEDVRHGRAHVSC